MVVIKKNIFSFINEFLLLTNLKINGIRKRNTLMNSPVTEWVFLTWNKKRKDNLETRAAFIEISILKFTKRPKTPWTTFEKIWFSLKGISYFQVIFMLFWMKWTLVCFDLQGDGTGNGLPNIKDAFAESFELQLSVLYQSICIFKAGLSSLSDDWAKYKEKLPDVSDSNHVLKQDAISISSLQDLKIYSSKECRKLAKDELCV